MTYVRSWDSVGLWCVVRKKLCKLRVLNATQNATRSEYRVSYSHSSYRTQWLGIWVKLCTAYL